MNRKDEIQNEIDALNKRIAELKEEEKKLPTNNHPTAYVSSQVYMRTSGSKKILYIVIEIGDQIRLMNLGTGNIWSSVSLFNDQADRFEFLGYAADVLTLKEQK